MIVGMSIGVNMLKADSRLWVSVSTRYNGFAFEPSKGWLSATTNKSTEHNRQSTKEKSTVPRMSKTTVDVRA
jgi:hypothetical protein